MKDFTSYPNENEKNVLFFLYNNQKQFIYKNKILKQQMIKKILDRYRAETKVNYLELIKNIEIFNLKNFNKRYKL